MTGFKAIVVIMKCEHCGTETSKIIPLEISESDWLRTQEKYGEMITERIELS